MRDKQFTNIDHARNYLNSKDFKIDAQKVLGQNKNNVFIEDERTNNTFLMTAIDKLKSPELRQLLRLRLQGYSHKRLSEFFKTDPMIIRNLEKEAISRVKDAVASSKIQPVILDSGHIAK